MRVTCPYLYVFPQHSSPSSPNCVAGGYPTTQPATVALVDVYWDHRLDRSNFLECKTSSLTDPAPVSIVRPSFQAKGIAIIRILRWLCGHINFFYGNSYTGKAYWNALPFPVTWVIGWLVDWLVAWQVNTKKQLHSAIRYWWLRARL